MGNSALPVKILLILFLATNINISFSKDSGDLGKVANAKMKGWQIPVKEWRHIARPETDSVVVDKDQHKITLYFKPSMVYFPFREEHLGIIMKSVTERLGRKFRKYSVEIRAGTFNIDELIPNYYRKSIQTDIRRLPVKKPDNRQVVRRISGYVPEEGLYGNSIALWHSHGYYFEMSLDRWEWQRARLFGTVEDISVMAYVLPYLTPMLENAGANVFLPRERDIQINEVIVDNDRSTGNSEVVLHLNGSKELLNDGFTLVDTLFPGINPFHRGTSFKADGDSARFIPDIPETGEYAVYIAYPAFSDNSADVLCSVTHSGGRTDFKLDQTIGGSTWIYLGTFRFLNGKDQNSGSLTIMKAPGSKGYFTVDAVKFGGGMGNTARRPSAEITRNRQSALDTPDIPERISGTETVSYSWKLSGVPRYLEGSRYWLQYAGMPDTLVYSPTLGKNDYIDDYQSRSAWVNNLIAPTDNSGKGGKGIPIDISLAFHTDAGITPDDSIIGTLAIYSTASNSGRFTDQTSRLASRDFSDIVQTYVVEDIRKQFNPQWTRRGIWDRSY
jgi:hypothetical protein